MRPHKPSSRRDAGFSLMEVLVVVVIIAMISITLMMGLSQSFEARARLAPLLDRHDQTALTTNWFRHLTTGVIPDYNDGPSIFNGSALHMGGRSLMGIGGDLGVPTPFSLDFTTLENDRTALRYSASGVSIDIAAWTQAEAGLVKPRFYYFDGKNWLDHWPLSDEERRAITPMGALRTAVPDQLPRLVRAELILAGQAFVLVAAPGDPDANLARLGDSFR